MNGCRLYRIVADLGIHGDGERGSPTNESLCSPVPAVDGIDGGGVGEMAAGLDGNEIG
jgi:hypothetical protein